MPQPCDGTLLEQPERVAVAVVDVDAAWTPAARWRGRSSRPGRAARAGRAIAAISAAFSAWSGTSVAAGAVDRRRRTARATATRRACRSPTSRATTRPPRRRAATASDGRGGARQPVRRRRAAPPRRARQLACSAALSSTPEPARATRLDAAGRASCGGTARRRAPDRSRALTTRVGVVGADERDLGARGDVQPGLDHAVVAERDADAGVGAEQGALADARRRSRPPPDRVPMIEAPPPMSEPSPTTTPAEMRPSTIDVPSVPALKLTKPSCMTVVPAARCAPRRTRSASAIRTPGGHDVVDHPRELVDAEHRDRDARARRAAAAGSASKPSTAHGPRSVHTTFGSTPKMPVEVLPVRVRPAGARAGAGAGRRRRCRPAGRPGRSRCADHLRRARRGPSSAPREAVRLGGRRSSPGGLARAPGTGYQTSSVGAVVGHRGQAEAPGRPRHGDQPR